MPITYGGEMKRRILMLMMSAFAASAIVGCKSGTVKVPPYGICENIAMDYNGSHDKFTHGELDLMKEAKIDWVRTDFDWSRIQPKKGEWDFKVVDESVQWAEESGVTVLPILNRSSPWASPAYRNIDEWLEFVRMTVSRYKGRLHYWEVWNEENLSSSQDKITDPILYAYFLKRTYQEIKKADPGSKVLIGGLSCIPYDYLEAFYKAEGKGAFDIMNIHPYALQDRKSVV